MIAQGKNLFVLGIEISDETAGQIIEDDDPGALREWLKENLENGRSRIVLSQHTRLILCESKKIVEEKTENESEK